MPSLRHLQGRNFTCTAIQLSKINGSQLPIPHGLVRPWFQGNGSHLQWVVSLRLIRFEQLEVRCEQPLALLSLLYPLLTHPLSKTFLQISKSLVQRLVFVLAFPHHTAWVDGPNEGCARTIIVMPDFNPTNGVNKMGNIRITRLWPF
jgi:hypothetical protein